MLSSGLTCAAQWVLTRAGLGRGLCGDLHKVSVHLPVLQHQGHYRGQCGTTRCSIPVRPLEQSLWGFSPTFTGIRELSLDLSPSSVQCELCTVSSVQQPLCCHSPPAATFGEWDAGTEVPGMLAVQGGSWGREAKLSFPNRSCPSPWTLSFKMLFLPLSAVLNYLGLTGMAFCFFLRIASY